ncbi:unnamed protein product [Scytosiphon promiscuus]
MSGASTLRETGREALTFSGMGAAVFAGLPAFEAVHFQGPGEPADDQHSEPSVTLLKLNTAVGQDLSALLSMSLVDVLAARGPALRRLIVVVAVQPPKRHQLPTTAAKIPPDSVCTFSCGVGDNEVSSSSSVSSSPSFSGLPVLPTGARIADLFLTNLVRLCRLEELPLIVLARLGYRTTGAAADVDGTDEAIVSLGQCLAKSMGLEFDSERACGARRSKGWKGAAPAQLVPGYI